MKIIIQRVSESSVTVSNNVIGKIGNGFLVLLGISHDDDNSDINYLIKKITQLRIFNDSDGKMNLSLADVHGEVLVISQFTLHAKTKKGNRPSYIDAARPEIAVPLYLEFINQLKFSIGENKVAQGEFGADMKIQLINDGPVTIIIDSKDRT